MQAGEYWSGIHFFPAAAFTPRAKTRSRSANFRPSRKKNRKNPHKIGYFDAKPAENLWKSGFLP
jgi:hypothetical protein